MAKRYFNQRLYMFTVRKNGKFIKHNNVTAASKQAAFAAVKRDLKQDNITGYTLEYNGSMVF